MPQPGEPVSPYYEGLTAIYRAKDPKKPAEILERSSGERRFNDTLRADRTGISRPIYSYYDQLGKGARKKRGIL